MLKEFKLFSARIGDIAAKITKAVGEGDKYTTPEVLAGIGLMLAALISTSPEQKDMVIDFLKFLPEQLEKVPAETPDKDEVN